MKEHDGKTIASTTWHVDDVHQQAEQDGVEITEEQAIKVLQALSVDHDATIGTNWDVISCQIENVLRESGGNKT